MIKNRPIVLITGARGSIAKRLAQSLAHEYEIRWLSRRAKPEENVFAWDIEKMQMDSTALEGVQHIIHLAGAGIADKRWTEQRKQEIIDSRVKSAALLFDNIQQKGIRLNSFISASAIGYYGAKGEGVFTETMDSGDDFLGQVCKNWEESAYQFEQLGARVVCVRVGIVLSKQFGALVPMLKSFSPLGSGRQPLSWIHEKDITRVFEFVLRNESIRGSFNAVAGVQSNREFMKMLTKLRGGLFLPIAVPSVLLKLVLGERVTLVSDGVSVSNQKLLSTGFEMEYTDLKRCLQDLLKK